MDPLTPVRLLRLGRHTDYSLLEQAVERLVQESDFEENPFPEKFPEEGFTPAPVDYEFVAETITRFVNHRMSCLIYGHHLRLVPIELHDEKRGKLRVVRSSDTFFSADGDIRNQNKLLYDFTMDFEEEEPTKFLEIDIAIEGVLARPGQSLVPAYMKTAAQQGLLVLENLLIYCNRHFFFTGGLTTPAAKIYAQQSPGTVVIDDDPKAFARALRKYVF